MKKLLLLLLLSILIGPLYGQLLNSSFETWNSTAYDEPNGWQTGNHESASLGLTPVTRTNGVSGYAVRMQTIAYNGDTAQAFIANGDPMGGEGGIPFAEQPTAITGSYRYNLPGNDTALILVLFKKNGNIISSDIFKIRGTGVQNSFTSFSFPINLPMTPDSVIVAATCSNLIENVGVQNGSFMELDGIAFAGTTTSIDNGTFETWTTHSTDIISDWGYYGDGISKTTDSYDGTYAISLSTVDYGNGDIGSAGITNGHNTQTGPTGGSPYTLTVDTLTGYYKYFTSGNDSASININLLQNSNYVSGNQKLLPATSQYTYFEIPIYSGTAPDTMRVDITSSKWPYSPSSVGSTLYIDHLQFKSELTAGVAENKNRNAAFVYPNPANDVLHIRLNNNTSERVQIEIFDLAGRTVMNETKSVMDNEMSIRISSLIPGKYFYRVTDGKNRYQQAFTKQ
jgi:hypothetical protein